MLSLDLLLYDGTRLTVGVGEEDRLDALVAQDGRVGDIYRRLKILRDAHADAIRARFPDIPAGSPAGTPNRKRIAL